jgi:hypothetical protein
VFIILNFGSHWCYLSELCCLFSTSSFVLFTFQNLFPDVLHVCGSFVQVVQVADFTSEFTYSIRIAFGVHGPAVKVGVRPSYWSDIKSTL